MVLLGLSINLDKNALELVDFCSKFLKNIFMAQVEGQGGFDRAPFRSHGLGSILESRDHAAEVLRDTEAELARRVQVFLLAKIGQCRNDDGEWHFAKCFSVRIEGEYLIIPHVSYHQYGKPDGSNETGRHILPLLEAAGWQVLFSGPDLSFGNIAIKVPLAEFNQLTGVEDEGGYGGGDDCGVAALAAHQMASSPVKDGVASVGGQALEAVGFSVAAGRKGGGDVDVAGGGYPVARAMDDIGSDWWK